MGARRSGRHIRGTRLRPADRIPPLAELAGPGQTIIDVRNDPRFDVVGLAYRHEGADWRQSHHLVPFGVDRVLIVTAQSPATRVTLTWNAAETVARSVTARPRDPGGVTAGRL